MALWVWLHLFAKFLRGCLWIYYFIVRQVLVGGGTFMRGFLARMCLSDAFQFVIQFVFCVVR